MAFNILDCTLRDGGYYNNWDFSTEVVEAYLKSVVEAKIDYVELGLRNFPKQGFFGAYAYTTEQHLKTLVLPKGPVYGVMVDAKTLLVSELGVDQAIDALFVPASDSKIGLVRIAAHFDDVEKSGPIALKLKALGYLVGFNLMQAGGKPSSVIAQKAKQVMLWGCVDVLYFADSLGNMDNEEIVRIVNALRIEWAGQLGIHTHNNMGRGLDNTLLAKELGVSWLDTTVTGMGRGAGNTQTENLLAILAEKCVKYNPKPIYDVVIRFFEPMQKKYGWGSNLLYFLGAQNNIHPTYIQSLLSNSHYGIEEIVGAISYLSKLEGAASYDGLVLDHAVNFKSTSKKVSGSRNVVDMFRGKEVLVIANGASSQTYKKAIELYIREKQPIVISVNLNESIEQGLVDYFVISHNVKFLSDSGKYEQITKPVILPKHRFTDEELEKISHLTLIDYGFEVSSKLLTVGEISVSAPYDLTSAYLFGVIANGKPTSVKMIGFDGYEKGDVRQQEMLDLVNQYNSLENIAETIALTPTSYPLTQGSIYAIHS